MGGKKDEAQAKVSGVRLEDVRVGMRVRLAVSAYPRKGIAVGRIGEVFDIEQRSTHPVSVLFDDQWIASFKPEELVSAEGQA